MIFSASPLIYWYVALLTTPEEYLRHQGANPQHIPPHRNDPNAYRHHGNMDDTPHGDKAGMTVSEDAMDWDSRGIRNKLLFAYFHLYFFVGVAAFANFLPWT